MVKVIVMTKMIWVATAFVLMMAGCACKKTRGTDHFGTEVNHPKFKGPIDFIKSFHRVNKIFVLGKCGGGKVIKPWVKNDGWLTPAFREQLCLVVTLNNHCVG